MPAWTHAGALVLERGAVTLCADCPCPPYGSVSGPVSGPAPAPPDTVNTPCCATAPVTLHAAIVASAEPAGRPCCLDVGLTAVLTWQPDIQRWVGEFPGCPGLWLSFRCLAGGAEWEFDMGCHYPTSCLTAGSPRKRPASCEPVLAEITLQWLATNTPPCADCCNTGIGNATATVRVTE